MVKPAARHKALGSSAVSSCEYKSEPVLYAQEIALLEKNCEAQRQGHVSYALSDYITMLIRRDYSELHELLQSTGLCGKCGDTASVATCPCIENSTYWVTNGWQKLKLVI